MDYEAGVHAPKSITPLPNCRVSASLKEPEYALRTRWLPDWPSWTIVSLYSLCPLMLQQKCSKSQIWIRLKQGRMAVRYCVYCITTPLTEGAALWQRVIIHISSISLRSCRCRTALGKHWDQSHCLESEWLLEQREFRFGPCVPSLGSAPFQSRVSCDREHQTCSQQFNLAD